MLTKRQGNIKKRRSGGLIRRFNLSLFFKKECFMKKRIGIAVLAIALISVVAFAAEPTWSWSGDEITVTSDGLKDYTVSLAVTISSGSGENKYESCNNIEIYIPKGQKKASWNVKDKIGRSASILGVSLNWCK